jgi:hypothetical protein
MALHRAVAMTATPNQRGIGPSRRQPVPYVTHASHDISTVHGDDSIQLSMHEVTAFSSEQRTTERPRRNDDDADESFEVRRFDDTSAIPSTADAGGCYSPREGEEEEEEVAGDDADIYSAPPPMVASTLKQHPSHHADPGEPQDAGAIGRAMAATLAPRDPNAQAAKPQLPASRPHSAHHSPKRIILQTDDSSAEGSALYAMPPVAFEQSRPRSPLQDVAHMRREVDALREEKMRLSVELDRMAQEHRDTSMVRDDREQECVELNSLVDDLQQQLDDERHRHQATEGRAAAAEAEVARLRALPSDAQLKQLLHGTQRRADEANKKLESAHRQVSALKLQRAEFQAVLDRLGLAPPFDDALIGNAVLRLNALAPLHTGASTNGAAAAPAPEPAAGSREERRAPPPPPRGRSTGVATPSSRCSSSTTRTASVQRHVTKSVPPPPPKRSASSSTPLRELREAPSFGPAEGSVQRERSTPTARSSSARSPSPARGTASNAGSVQRAPRYAHSLDTEVTIELQRERESQPRSRPPAPKGVPGRSRGTPHAVINV